VPWTEPAGDDTWRVRYRRADGTKGAISGFPDANAADDHISTMLHEQRTGTWIDPEDGRTTIAEFAPAWLDSLDIDQRTEENYRSFLKVHILPRWGNAAFAELTTSRSAPGRRSSAPPAWRRPPSTASSSASRCCFPTPCRRS
jgi:hypothetical protein